MNNDIASLNPQSSHVPCPNCQDRLYFPDPSTLPQYVLNLPTVSMLVVSHELVVRCRKCDKAFTVGIVPQVPWQAMIAEIKPPEPGNLVQLASKVPGLPQ